MIKDMFKLNGFDKYMFYYKKINLQTFFTLENEEIIKEIMSIDGTLLEYVDDCNKTFDVCLEAVLSNNDAISFLPMSLTEQEKNILNSAIYKLNDESVENVNAMEYKNALL